ncbi:SDR family NAD(P)-dependent oxidoreductase [Streptomyces sp. NBC_01565]|uniref:SDR family NAD(P)-dependent oxidoreductase n=1 Tax=Streptomyces sp. NBC_01565 TaxID=2975881 RepID=UPI00225A35F7|nr:SDR family NAD(P)-dependent oxidoreductase [Streptomyces sp. NBC_01565]MCX4545462.1 SDR family NAD(P)-dependent oxidoreductase [Streptomyces sp. NBC_01565]
MHSEQVQMVLLSAADEERLVRLARLYHEFLAGLQAGAADGSGAPALADIAFTTQTGRVPLGHRLAVLCRTAGELSVALDDVAHGRPAATVRRSVVHAAAARGAGPASVGDPQEALAAWLAGLEVDWRGLWPTPGRRVTLPSYPFEDAAVEAGDAADPAEAVTPGSGTDTGPGPGPGPDTDTGPGAGVGLDTGLDTGPGAEPVADGWAVDYLRRVFAETAGLDPAEVLPYAALEELGLSSFLISRLNARLERDLGERSRTLFFHHGTLAAIAAVLATRHPAPVEGPAEVEAEAASAGVASATAPAAPVPVRRPGRAAEPLAVVGIAGRFPGAASLPELWEVLRTGTTTVGPVPADRVRPGWPASLMHGGYLADVDRFDPLLFGITPRHAELMDPQERLCLETVWEALDDAGYPARRLRAAHASRVGVYVGSMYNEYPYFGVEQSRLGAPADSGSPVAGIANRVSYAFDLHGPSMTVDTMCSASLVALHLAARALRAGDCDAAVVAATNLSLHPNKFRQIERLGGASSDHLCRSFGNGGDGMVPAEAVCVLILKPLSAAEAAGDRVHALVSGTAVLNSGRTNGWIVPSPTAQAEVVREALADAGLAPGDIGYLEAHGAGTALGDPIEADGLQRIFGPDRIGHAALPIGSVKSNIGHAEASAGLAGIAKVVLQFAHRTLAPSLHAEELNPDIDWATAPLRVQRALEPWTPPDGAPRRAGVSSFGAGGTLAHAVLEEPPAHLAQAAPRPAAPAAPVPVLLSAYDEERLREVVARLLAHLREHPRTDLADLAFTLAEGRHHLRERAAAVVSGTEELAGLLRRHLDGDTTALLRGRAPSGREPDGTPLAGDPAELARLWVTGRPVVVAPPPGRPPRVLTLPAYPFARMRCWLPEPAAGPEAGVPAPSGELPLYRKTWHAAGPVAAQGRPAGSLLCLYGAASRDLARALVAEAGADRVHLVREDSGDGEAHGVLTGGSGAELADRAIAAHPDLAAVLDLTDLGRAPGAAGAWEVRLGLLQRLTATAARRTGSRAPLHVLHVTRGRRAVQGAPGHDTGARMAGFVRFLGAESSHLTGVTLDLDERAGDPRSEVAELLAALPGNAYGEAVHRGGQLFLPALTPLTGPLPPAPRLDHFGAYLLTGATRGIGSRVARHLVERGARHLALLGARSLPPADRWDAPDLGAGARAAVASVRALENAGARVHVHRGSLLDRAGLEEFLHGVREAGGPVRGAVHCAAVTPAVGSFAGRDTADIRRVLEPKADALEVLYQLCLPDRPDFLVAFSSLAAVVPPVAAGVLEYAAANSFVDDFTEQLARVTPWVHSVAWPMWRDSGAAGPGAQNPGARFGLDSAADTEALRALDRVITADTGGPVIALRPLCTTTPSTLLRLPTPTAPVAPGAVPPGPAAPASAAPGAIPPAVGGPGVVASAAAGPGAVAPGAAGPGGVALGGVVSRAVPPGAMAHVPVAERAVQPGSPIQSAPRRTVPAWLTGIFAGVVGIPSAEFDPLAEFAELGVESVMLGELLDAIEQQVGQALDPALLLEYSTLRTLAARLEEILPTQEPEPERETSPPPESEPESGPGSAAFHGQGGAAGPGGHAPAPVPTPALAPTPAPAPPQEAIAVIGMACRLPGASDVAAFWRNLRAGHLAIGEVPRGRWDVSRFYRPTARTGRTVGKWGGFVHGIEDFDDSHFGLTEDQARYLDPTIRLFLETTADCLRDAGLEGPELAGRDVGVFAGARGTGYAARGPMRPEVPESDTNFVASHVGQHFDLRGPHLVVDSACSSSLVAIHLACQSLRSGEIEAAVAGGSSILLDEEPYLEFSAAGALSPTGRCSAFDQRADGFVPGEGSVVLLLKPLYAALRDGDPVHGVIEGSAVTNDGRTMGLTTPNPAAQAAAVRRALHAAGRAPAEVGMIEAHGTGTAIGDPLEFRALRTVFDADRADRAGRCLFGSVKTNVGHLLHAAGAVGLLKALLAVEHGIVPPTLNCERPNPRLKLEDSPFALATEAREWPLPGLPRVAGVSSFGFGGTNAHVVVAQAPAQALAAAGPRRGSRPPIAFERRRLWLERPVSQEGDPREPAAPPERSPLRLAFT